MKKLTLAVLLVLLAMIGYIVADYYRPAGWEMNTRRK